MNQFELNTSYISDLGDWYELGFDSHLFLLTSFQLFKIKITRYVPYKDLYNIYLEFYGKEEITEIDIIECSSLLFAGR